MQIWQIELGETGPRGRRKAAREALRAVLAERLGCDREALRFAAGPHGKPSLCAPGPGRRLHFNLSHSAGVALVAVSEDGPVGIDVEEMRALPDLERLVGFACTAAERRAILAAPEPERLRTFYRCWVRKEASLKAVGTGLSAGPRSVSVSTGPLPAVLAGDGTGALSLRDLPLPAGYTGAVALAAPRQPGELTLERYPPS